MGDFSSKQFRIPRELEDGIVDALRAGESTYPPPNGLESLRTAVRDFYQRRLGLDFPMQSILIASGARPAIYALYRAVVDPGERWSSACRRGTTTTTVRCSARCRS